MPKQNQILAIEKGTKKRVYDEVTKEHHKLKKSGLLEGISRTYQSKDDDGEQYPDEEKLVQVRAHEVIKTTLAKFPELWNIVATKDFTNCTAKADIIVNEGQDDEKTVAKDVPATHLLWLQKQLDDLHTFVRDLPTLPADHRWEFDDQQNCWRSKEVRTAKKKKIPTAFELSPATKEHPAQVQRVDVDQIEGYWTTTHFSGAMKATTVADMLERVQQLQQAVQFARERANGVDALMQKTGDGILNHVFGDFVRNAQ